MAYNSKIIQLNTNFTLGTFNLEAWNGKRKNIGIYRGKDKVGLPVKS